MEFYLAVQNLSTATLFPPMTKGCKTRLNAYFTQLMTHMLHVWMEGDAWIKDAQAKMNVTNYMEMVRLIEDMNTVNSIKNRNTDGKEETIKNRNTGGKEEIITSENAAQFCNEISYVNQLQMRDRGPTDGTVASIAILDSGSNMGVVGRRYVPLDLPSCPPTTNIQITDAQFHAAQDVATHHHLYSMVDTYAGLMAGHHAQVHERRECSADLASYRHFFLNAPHEVIQHTGFNAPAPSLAYKSVGNDVIASVLLKVLWGITMRIPVHEASVREELMITQVHDTSVLLEPSSLGNDVTAMHSNKNDVADNHDYPLALVNIVPELIEIHDRSVLLMSSCLMCGADHVSWTEEYDRQLNYGEHCALSRYDLLFGMSCEVLDDSKDRNSVCYNDDGSSSMNITNCRGRLISAEREIIESTIGSRQITNRSLRWGAIRSDHHGSTQWKVPYSAIGNAAVAVHISSNDGDSISTTMPPYYALCITGTTGELQDFAWMILKSIDFFSSVWNAITTSNMRTKRSWRTRIRSHNIEKTHITSNENGELYNDTNHHYSIDHFYSADIDTFSIIVTSRLNEVKYYMTPAVDVSGIIISHEVTAVAGYLDDGIYCKLGEVIPFASVIASSFNELNAVDVSAPSPDDEYVGKAVIASAVWIGLCGDLMCTQVHDTFVWGDLTCTKAYDTSVLIEPLHHSNDVSAMHLTQVNNSSIADSDGFPFNDGFVYSHNADLVLVIIVPTLMDITECGEGLIVVARDIYGLVYGTRLIATVERCLICDNHHVSWTEEINRRLNYGEHRVLPRHGEQSSGRVGIASTEINSAHNATLNCTGRDLLSLVNEHSYNCDGLNIPDIPPSVGVVFDELTYGNEKGSSNSESVISGELDALTWVPEWGELEGVMAKQQPKTIDTRDKRMIGISGYYRLMNHDEHEPSSKDVVTSGHSWGATSTTFAAVNSDDSLLQAINEYNFDSVNDCSGVLTMNTISRRRQLMLVFAIDLGHADMLCSMNSTDGSPCMIFRLRPICNDVCNVPMTTAPATTMNISASTGSVSTAFADTNVIIHYDAPAHGRRHPTSTGSEQAHYVAAIEDCSMRQAVHETYAYCADAFTIHYMNDYVNHAMPEYFVEDTTRQYLLGPCDMYHSALGDSILVLTGNDALANDDWYKAWSIGSYFEYTCGDDELTFGMEEVATPHGNGKDLLYFVAVKLSDNHVGPDGSSNPYSTVLGTRYTADSAFASYKCMLVNLFCGESSDTKDALFDVAIYTTRTMLERTKVKSTSLCLEGLSPEQLASDAQPHGKLHERHLKFSYHYACANIAAGVLRFAFVRGTNNPADTLSKHWACSSVWPLIKPILFWSEDMMDILSQDAWIKNRRGV